MQASAFASDIDAYIAYIDLERGLSRNTRENYQRDLEQCARFMARTGAADWRNVTAEQAGAWVRSLSRSAASSQARKLTALRMFARFLVREALRPLTPQFSADVSKTSALEINPAPPIGQGIAIELELDASI